MVDFKKLSDRAKDLVDKRGGTDGLKRDADKLKNIATGKGSLSDKAKAAAQALKETPREQAASGSVADAPAAGKKAPAGKTAAKKKPAAKAGGTKAGAAKKAGARKASGGAKKPAQK
ncbi:hypothetical protein BH24ACT23_BH24ACT23_09630 [soil metagenome]|jgi:peptidoglycan hydrolase CwlO-like protein